MNKLIGKSVIPFSTLAVAMLFLIATAIILMSGITHAGDNSQSGKGRLITIYDRGVEKVILSESATIGDALKEAGIAIDNKDAVEPAVTEKLVASEYQVNIYRARPVIIIDGNVRQKVVTPYQTAEQIAKDAGITLYAEDKTTIGRSDNVADGAGLQLTINRATSFVFDQYGKAATVRTQAKTVGEMLFEKGIKLSADDKVTPSQDTALTEGLAVRVWREGKQTITVDEPIDFDIEKIEDADQLVSYHEIMVAGTQGIRSVSYEITIENGQESGRVEIVSVTTKQPTSQIEKIGIKGKYTTPSENENITWNFLIVNGFSKIQTAGIMGNLKQEHGFNTTDTNGGLGLVQWTGSRRSNLISQYPDSYTNIYSQLAFLMSELNGGYAGVRDSIKASNSLTESVQIFQNRFERCGYCMEDQRILYAQTILGSH